MLYLNKIESIQNNNAIGISFIIVLRRLVVCIPYILSLASNKLVDCHKVSQFEITIFVGLCHALNTKVVEQMPAELILQLVRGSCVALSR